MPSPASRLPPRRCSAGVTLWELLCTLTVAGICVSLAVPSWQTVILDSRRNADVYGFVAAVQLARSEAAKRGRPVVLCASVDLAACVPSYSAGWIVFVNEDDERPPHRDPEEPLLRAYRPASAGTITSNRPVFEFRPFHRRSTNGTVTFCDRRGAAAARAVIVSYTGRPRTAATGPGRRLTCA